MDNFFKYAADIISAAAASPLGILALLILVVAVVAIYFFKGAPVWARIFIFLVIVAATCSFGSIVLRKTKDIADEKAQAATERAFVFAASNVPPATAASSPIPDAEVATTNSAPVMVTAAALANNNVDDIRWEQARNNINWVFKDAGAKRTYEMAVSHGLSKYQAILAAQGHDPSAQQTVAALGETRVEQFVNSLGH